MSNWQLLEFAMFKTECQATIFLHLEQVVRVCLIMNRGRFGDLGTSVRLWHGASIVHYFQPVSSLDCWCWRWKKMQGYSGLLDCLFHKVKILVNSPPFKMTLSKKYRSIVYKLDIYIQSFQSGAHFFHFIDCWITEIYLYFLACILYLKTNC